MPNDPPVRRSAPLVAPSRVSRWKRIIIQRFRVASRERRALYLHAAAVGLVALLLAHLGGVEAVKGGAVLAVILWGVNALSERNARKRAAELEATARGRKLLTRAEAFERATKIATSADEETIIWGTLPIRLTSLHSHGLICGSVSSGKTLTYRMLMNQLLPRIILGEDRRAMIFDPKLEMAQIVGSMQNLRCPVHLFSPQDRRSVAWDLASDIVSAASAFQFATAVFPTGRDTQPYFRDASRSLFSSVVTSLIKRESHDWTLRDVLLIMRSKRAIRRLLAQDPAFDSIIENFLDIGETPLASVMSTAATFLTPLEPIAALWNRATRKLSIKEWVRSESILILGGDPRMKATLDKLNALCVDVAAQEILGLSESTSRLSLFLFDEMRECGRLPGLERLILSGRSKGASVIAGFQDIEGMAEVYGERVAHELLGQCGLKAFLRMESPKTAEWAERCIGNREKVECQVSRSWSSQGASSSESYQRQTRPQVLASELLDLPVTNPTNGLHGVYIAREIGAYRAQIAWSEVERSAGRIDRSIPGLDAVPAEWQQLSMLSAEEEARIVARAPTEPEAIAGNSASGSDTYSPLRQLDI